MIKRMLAVWHARNLEFVRDRSTMFFTLLLPIVQVIEVTGFSLGPAPTPPPVGGMSSRISTVRESGIVIFDAPKVGFAPKLAA